MQDESALSWLRVGGWMRRPDALDALECWQREPCHPERRDTAMNLRDLDGEVAAFL